MHEVLFDDRFLKDTGVTTLDFAKALIDEGFHPMTMYFPLVVHGAMLIEPTETESKASLDQFIAVLRGLAERAKVRRRRALPQRAASDAAPPPRRNRRRPQAGVALAPGTGAAGSGRIISPGRDLGVWRRPGPATGFTRAWRNGGTCDVPYRLRRQPLR